MNNIMVASRPSSHRSPIAVADSRLQTIEPMTKTHGTPFPCIFRATPSDVLPAVSPCSCVPRQLSSRRRIHSRRRPPLLWHGLSGSRSGARPSHAALRRSLHPDHLPAELSIRPATTCCARTQKRSRRWPSRGCSHVYCPTCQSA